MARRRLSRKQRRYFGKRTVTRRTRRSSVGRTIKRRRSSGRRSSFGFGNILPVSIKEGMIDVGSGFISPWENAQVAKITMLENLLSNLGNYKDEARTGIIGVVKYKFGGMIHPLVRESGRSDFKYALYSTGIQTAANSGFGMSSGSNETSSLGSNGLGYY